MDTIAFPAGLSDQPGLVAGLAAAIFAAALIRGFTGFGFALAAVPLLGFWLPPSQCVPLAVGLQFCASLSDLPRARKSAHWPSLRWLVAGTAIGSPLGVAALALASPDVARLAIALVCGGGTIALVRGFRFPAPPGGRETVMVGLAAGLCNGLAAMPGPPVVAYYLAMPLTPQQGRASLLVFFLATSVASVISLVSAGLVGAFLAVPLAIGIPLILVGSRLGERLLRRSGGRGHRALSILLLGAVAAVSAAQAVSHLLGPAP
ncbi:sulfite exporter TauE/SafE family protein [Methylobacterium sp. NEAU K]|uniref:sulfite exporter TauE/SafE family protein n=1 Tax=Methylobacterium sp. NEAU K TaxID=3064946 RepID=UPI002732608D|nr:sulfite exporter TauE/SafE family protein [Methylobacterium sp. NEAU K]MDP4005220.1 sulfite exporter TauE/SafE family protein [Methylobacterium sp. NEAU K]